MILMKLQASKPSVSLGTILRNVHFTFHFVCSPAATLFGRMLKFLLLVEL